MTFPLHGHWVGDHSDCRPEWSCQRPTETEMNHDRYMDLYNTMREGQELLNQRIDAIEAQILAAVIDDPQEGSRLFGKPIRLKVEWPEGLPWPEEKLHALVRDMLNRRRNRLP